MPPRTPARLHLPRPALGACLHLGVERDTRGLALSPLQRLNHYPATPLPSVSWIFEGELQLVQAPGSAGQTLSPALPALVFAGASRRPTVSWSPGPVHALTVSFYPEALRRLGIEPGRWVDRIVPLEAAVQGELLECLAAVLQAADGDAFGRLQAALTPLWQQAHEHRRLPTMRAWVQAMAVHASFSPAGAGVRQAQRRFKDWTGQSQRELQRYVRTERALACAAAQPPDAAPDIAGLAADTGYADQSHLGREVRRVTGLSPARLSAFMRSDESFWFYRLLAGYLERERGG
ncbi:AraC family transcriptional regulator [Rubrivivax gelatinosus]|uniref:AraC family transcriptional regulator n=1 Tax=Rubrivivax gelatinosus TaxID=28068 RepID=UPI0002FC80F1|nr:helix-turn-helix domain-containing protein [Rubrivivax gelatinosus]MBG6081771.1 AraC-like DNA-binding protein [Rubrivivax gelatinosus]